MTKDPERSHVLYIEELIVPVILFTVLVIDHTHSYDITLYMLKEKCLILFSLAALSLSDKIVCNKIP
jgi:hypothetical protein